MSTGAKGDNGAGSGLETFDNAVSPRDPEQIAPPPPTRTVTTVTTASRVSVASSSPIRSQSRVSVASTVQPLPDGAVQSLPNGTVNSGTSTTPQAPDKKRNSVIHNLEKEIPKLIEQAVVKEKNQDIKRMLKATMRTEQQVPREKVISYLEGEVNQNDKCFEFPFVFFKFLFFSLMVLSHETISDVSQLERNFRGFSEGTGFEGYWSDPPHTGKLTTSGHKDILDIDTVDDIYTYLHDAILPLFIPPLDVKDPYRALRYNQLIGGVKMSQLRRERKNCAEQYPNMGPFNSRGTNPFMQTFDCFPQGTYSTACFGLGEFNEAAKKRGWCNDINYRDDDSRRLQGESNTTGLRMQEVFRRNEKADSTFEMENESFAHVSSAADLPLEAALYGFRLSNKDQHTTEFIDEEEDEIRLRPRWQKVDRAKRKRRLKGNDDVSRRLNFDKAAAKQKLGNQKGTAGFFGVDYAEYFSVFMHESEGIAAAQEKLAFLREYNWIDLQTYVLSIGVFLFNPDLGVFNSGNILIYFIPSGELIPFVQVTAFRAEPYGAVHIIVTDILWFCFYLHLCCCVLYRTCKAFVSKKNMQAYITSLWTYVEGATVIGGLVIIIFWFIYYGRLADVKDKALQVHLNRPPPGMSADTDEYLKKVASMHQEIGFLTGFVELYRVGMSYYFLLVGLRFFKAFEAQPRLAIITDTVTGCAVDFVHFFIVLMTMFMAFVLAGMFMFGHRIAEFATTYLACEKCFMMLMGDFDFDDISEETPVTAALWFHSYLILMCLIMLNMCLAIIMDVYGAVKSDSGLKDALWDQLKNMWDDFHAFRRGKIGTRDVLKVLNMMDLDLVSKNVLLEAIPTMRKAQAEELIAKVEELEAADDEETFTFSDAIKLIVSTKTSVKYVAKGIAEYVRLNRFMRDKLTGGYLFQSKKANKERRDKMNAKLDRASAARIKQLEKRIGVIEDFLNEVMCYFVFRGKEMRNRLQALEEFLRGQRDAAVHINQDMWDDAPKLPGYGSYTGVSAMPTLSRQYPGMVTPPNGSIIGERSTTNNASLGSIVSGPIASDGGRQYFSA